jgi:type I restriction enzyme, S subunit
MVPLRELLTERKESVRVTGELGEWQPITIKFSGDVIPRDRAEAFKGAMFAAHPGDVVFSKIDARNGAVGLIPATMPKVVLTPEYPVMAPDLGRLLPAYLHYLLRAEHFRQDLQRRASGTSGRKRVTPDAFLSLMVPVPTLDEQAALVKASQAALAQAASKESEAVLIAQVSQRAFEKALGIAPPLPLPDRPVFVARFKDVERWSHEGILRDATHAAATSAAWPIAPLATVAKVSYGLQKSPANRPGKHSRPYLRVANVQRGVLDLAEMKYMDVPDEDMPKLRLMDGDVLLCEGNSPDLVGRGAIWRNEIPDCIHQNHVLRARVDRSKLSPEFLLAVINSTHGQEYFRSKAKRTTNLASINSTEVSALPVPLPPVDTQVALVDALHLGEKLSQGLAQEAIELRRAAWHSFESALFEPRNLSAPPSHD